MAISDQTLSADVWTEIKTVLVNASITVDGKSATIQATNADTTDNAGATRKPFIIINPISLDETKDKFGSNQGKKFINVFIDCIYKNTLYVDELADQVTYALSESNIAGISLIGVQSDYAFTDPNMKKYHEKNLSFAFTRE